MRKIADFRKERRKKGRKKEGKKERKKERKKDQFIEKANYVLVNLLALRLK